VGLVNAIPEGFDLRVVADVARDRHRGASAALDLRDQATQAVLPAR
jgi:hypothetical protein